MKNKQEKNFTELRALKIGQKFEVHGLEEVFRNLKLLAVTDSACQVKGETSADDINDDESRNWKPLAIGHCFSPRTEVRLV